MTNEQLAEFIGQGGNDELLPILWERIRKLMYIKSDNVYSTMQSRFSQCGVDVWDLKQSCYMAFLKAVEWYKPEAGNKFTSYLSYPFKNAVNELIGVRTQRQKNEPLNNCKSLDVPVSEDNETMLADTIADDNAVNAVEYVEQADDYRVLHEVVNALKYPQNKVISDYYFEDKSLKEISVDMGVSSERVRQVKAKAFRQLRQSAPLLQLYRENTQHRQLTAMQRYRTRPDKALYIMELEKKILDSARLYRLS